MDFRLGIRVVMVLGRGTLESQVRGVAKRIEILKVKKKIDSPEAAKERKKERLQEDIP